MSKPTAGTAVADGTSVTYTAKAGFTGTDKFLWAWDGLDRYGENKSWPVEVSVTVVP